MRDMSKEIGIGDRILNCPNCGAPIVGERCEYCGTVFYDFSCIDVNSPCWIKIRYGDNVFAAKMYVAELDFGLHDDYCFGRNLLGEMPRHNVSHTKATLDLKLVTMGNLEVHKEEKIHE